MISIELWRAKIGLFNCSRRSRPSSITHSTNLQQTYGSFSTTGVSAGLFSSLCRSLLIRRALALMLVAVITHLLLSAGDIERNPGPIFYIGAKPTLKDLQCMSYTSEDGMTVPFRLMDRIRPRVTRLAIALGFPLHVIDKLEIKWNPVYYLLAEWLRGGNQEHSSRPLTWATLIAALEEAGLLEEVNILKKHFVATMVALEIPLPPLSDIVKGMKIDLIPGVAGGHELVIELQCLGSAEKEKQIAKRYIQDQHKVSIRSLKAFLIGPSRVGKTTTRRRLTHEIVLGSPNETVPSTGIDPPVTVSVLIGEKGWTSQDIGEQFRDLCSFLKQSSSTSGGSNSSSTTSLQRQSQPTPTKSTTTDSPVPAHQLPQHDEENPTLHIQDEVITGLSTLVENEQWEKIHEFLEKAGVLDLLHIVDIGGQPEFHEILPFLLHGPALNLIFFNLTEDIDKKYMVEYDGANGFKSLPYESDSTIREIIQRALCTISSLQTSSDHKPAVILIGTHFEKDKEAEFLAVDESVQASFENEWFMKNGTLRQVSKPGEKKRYIYFLDNVSGDSSDIDGLRDLIKTVVKSRNPEEIRTPYLLLHLFLRMKFERSPGWCSMEQCEAIAESCGISKHDLLEALKYLHDKFGTILYYPALPKLRQRVIVNVNLIMKPPAEMIRTAFGAKDEDPNTAKSICETGVVPEYLINKACSSSSSKTDDRIPTDEILELLESCCILYKYADPYTKKDIHFMPCLLKPDPNVEVESSDHELLSALPYSPLLLIPSTGFVPLGLFQASVCKFSKDENWYLDESNRFRNRIRFYFSDDFLHVEIRSLSSHLEVRILTEPDEINQRLITKFRYELWKMFYKVTSDIAHTKDVHWNFGFYCPHGLESGIRPHPARCLQRMLKNLESCEGTIKVICNTNGCKKAALLLKDKQNCWFMEVPKIVPVKKSAEKKDCQQRKVETDSSSSGASPADPPTATQTWTLPPTADSAPPSTKKPRLSSHESSEDGAPPSTKKPRLSSHDSSEDGAPPSTKKPRLSSHDSSEGTPIKATVDNILKKLLKIKYPDDEWNELAKALGVGGKIAGIRKNPTLYLTDGAKLEEVIRAFVFKNEEPKCWKMLVDAVFATGQELTAKELAADPEVNVPCPTD